MLDMSVPAVAKLRRLLDNLPREALPDILTSIIRTSNQEKLQVRCAAFVQAEQRIAFPSQAALLFLESTSVEMVKEQYSGRAAIASSL